MDPIDLDSGRFFGDDGQHDQLKDDKIVDDELVMC